LTSIETKNVRLRFVFDNVSNWMLLSLSHTHVKSQEPWRHEGMWIADNTLLQHCRNFHFCQLSAAAEHHWFVIVTG